MAFIAPFRGIRYDLKRIGEDLANLVAPPYDVVSDKERDQLVQKTSYNIFSLELPNPKNSAPDPYAHVRAMFKDWLARGVLIQEQAPAVYPYHITFRVNGTCFCRKGFVALVRLEEWETRIVRPHEQTFNLVTAERLKLLKSTHAQFSQVFMLYNGNSTTSQILSSNFRQRLYAVEDHLGNLHELFRLTDKEALRELHRALLNHPLYIADGHHRYTTALNFKAHMTALHGNDPSRGYNYLMVYLVDTSDEGLVVLPTHRLVDLPESMEPERLEKEGRRAFEIYELEGIKGMDPEALDNALRQELSCRTDKRAFGVVFGDRFGPRVQIWCLKKDSEPAKRLMGRLPSQISQLDVVLLRQLVIIGILGLDPDDPDDGKRIRYEADGKKALTQLDEGKALFYLRSTPVEQVIAVADAGLTMPHKSTFFYPKILTGLVLNSVDTPVEF